MAGSCINFIFGSLFNSTGSGRRNRHTARVMPDQSPVEPVQLSDKDLKDLVASAVYHDGVLTFMGQSRRISEKGYTAGT